MRSVSEIPIFCNVDRIDGHVPSPTPIVLIVEDSTKVIVVSVKPAEAPPAQCSAAITPAVNHPADPPPRITIRLMFLVCVISCFFLLKLFYKEYWFLEE